MSNINEYWINSFKEVADLMESKSITKNDISKMKYFHKLFGRELIYVSAIKL
jgi:DNA-binding Xre family transcriptional regulator